MTNDISYDTTTLTLVGKIFFGKFGELSLLMKQAPGTVMPPDPSAGRVHNRDRDRDGTPEGLTVILSSPKTDLFRLCSLMYIVVTDNKEVLSSIKKLFYDLMEMFEENGADFAMTKSVVQL